MSKWKEGSLGKVKSEKSHIYRLPQYLRKSQPLHLTQRKAPLTTIRIIPPPIRHRRDFPTPKKQKDK
jgi:hypothetical protein